MTVHLRLAEKLVRVDLGEGGDCRVDGREMSVDSAFGRDGVLSLLIDGKSYRCVLDRGPQGDAVIVGGKRYAFAVEDPRSLRSRRGAAAGADGPRAVKAPMPGRVVRLMCEVGDVVEEKQGLIVIEAMKMQNELKSPKSGKVSKVLVGVGDTVGAGDQLVVVE